MPLEDPIYPNWASIVESLAEDSKLSNCRRQPSFLLFLVIFVLFYFCFCIAVIFKTYIFTGKYGGHFLFARSGLLHLSILYFHPH
jgi:hypothetical protein